MSERDDTPANGDEFLVSAGHDPWIEFYQDDLAVPPVPAWSGTTTTLRREREAIPVKRSHLLIATAVALPLAAYAAHRVSQRRRAA